VEAVDIRLCDLIELVVPFGTAFTNYGDLFCIFSDRFPAFGIHPFTLCIRFGISFGEGRCNDAIAECFPLLLRYLAATGNVPPKIKIGSLHSSATCHAAYPGK